MMPKWPCMLLICGLAAAAGAAQLPRPGRDDARIQRAEYRAEDVVLVRAWSGYVTRIVFSEGETIVDVASGFADGWSFSPQANVLYIKPQAVAQQGMETMEPQPGVWDTNLQVKTDVRLYDFDLVLLGADTVDAQTLRRRAVAYRIAFDYPAGSPAGMPAAFKAVNRRYAMQVGENSAGIAPILADDDGKMTRLRFRDRGELPAIFAVNPTGEESLVNWHVEGDDVLVHRVLPALMLRLGRQVVKIINQGEALVCSR